MKRHRKAKETANLIKGWFWKLTQAKGRSYRNGKYKLGCRGRVAFKRADSTSLMACRKVKRQS